MFHLESSLLSLSTTNHNLSMCVLILCWNLKKKKKNLNPQPPFRADKQRWIHYALQLLSTGYTHLNVCSSVQSSPWKKQGLPPSRPPNAPADCGRLPWFERRFFGKGMPQAKNSYFKDSRTSAWQPPRLSTFPTLGWAEQMQTAHRDRDLNNCTAINPQRPLLPANATLHHCYWPRTNEHREKRANLLCWPPLLMFPISTMVKENCFTLASCIYWWRT